MILSMNIHTKEKRKPSSEGLIYYKCELEVELPSALAGGSGISQIQGFSQIGFIFG
jgi:hypothetical protein